LIPPPPTAAAEDSQGVRIGIDLGGTKIEGAALGADGQELARRRVPTPRTYEGSLDAIRDLVAWLEDAVGRPGSVGVGMPGTVSAAGIVKNANSTWLIGLPLPSDLEARLNRPVRVMNDANCFTLSEATDGAGAGADVVFGVILGTGVGGGLVVEGRCLDGPNRIAGEWGHNPLPWPTAEEQPGPECYCGKMGCVETFVSGPGLERDHLTVTGEALDSREVARRSGDGDPEARATMERYYDRLTRSLATVINVVDPDVVVLGGGLSNLVEIEQAVLDRLPAWVFSDSVATRVARNVHGDASGVRGAAWLWDAASSG